MGASKTHTFPLRLRPPMWWHDHDEPRASPDSRQDLPTAPPASEVRGAMDKAWTSAATLDSALTEIGLGCVQLVSEPRQ